MPPENGAPVTRYEVNLIVSQLETINAKLDAMASQQSCFVTRQDYDHHREVCLDSTRRVHEKIEDFSRGKMSAAQVALVSLLSSLLVGVAVALIMLAAQGGI